MSLKKNISAPVLLNDTKQQPFSADKGGTKMSVASSGAWVNVPESVRTATATTNREKTTNDGYVIITIDNFDKLQGVIFQLVNRLIQDPKYTTNKFATTWKAAMTHSAHPIKDDSSFRTVQKVLRVTDLQDYKRFLLTCPHLDYYIEFQESKSKHKGVIHFRLINQDKLPEVRKENEMANKVDQPGGEITIDDDGYMESCGTTTDFLVLMSQIWVIMTNYGKEEPDNDYFKTWDKWVKLGLTVKTTFQEMKSITNFEGLYEFYYFLKGCPAIIKLYDIKWNNKILYRHKETSTNEEYTPSQGETKGQNSSDSSVTTLEDKELFQAQAVHTRKKVDNNSATITPVTPAKNTSDDGDPIDIGMIDLAIPDIDHEDQADNWATLDNIELETYAIDTTTLETSLEFTVFHCYMCDLISKWRNTMELSTDIKAKWTKWIYQGFHKDKGFKDIKRVMGIERLPEYLKIIQECPLVTQNVSWEWHGATLKYWFINRTNNVEVDKAPNKIMNIKADLQLFSHKFDISLKDANDKLRDQLHRLDVLDERVRRYAKSLEHNLHTQGQRIMQDHKTTLAKITDNIAADFRRHVNDASLEMIGKFRMDANMIIRGLDAEVHDAAKIFQQKLLSESNAGITNAQIALDDKLKQLIGMITSTADNVVKDLKIEIGSNTGTTKDDNTEGKTPSEAAQDQETQRPVHKLFPNVDQSLLREFTPKNPYLEENIAPTGTTRQLLNTDSNIRDPTASPQRRGYQSNAYHYETGQERHANRADSYGENGIYIPNLQYDSIMKRAQVQFTGQNDILVFYNQLMNGVAHYGLYLRPVSDFAIGRSLCPDHYQGIPIDDERYKLMAGCLYQKLASFDTIPAEFTHARTVINRYAMANDGYKVLYTLVQPLMHRDSIEAAPQEEHWHDIHEYALKLQSYLDCENLAGRNYTPKEQTSLFLSGLSTPYKKAVKRAKTLLDTTNPADPTVPPVLKLSALPVTIERWQK